VEKEFKPAGYDYEGEVEGTLCTKCHNMFTKQDPDYPYASEISPIYKHELKTQDPEKQLYIECQECGKWIWGKPDWL
jgi:DNA-directed RNA polymerase subunit RPC12/RpoP